MECTIRNTLAKQNETFHFKFNMNSVKDQKRERKQEEEGEFRREEGETKRQFNLSSLIKITNIKY